MNFVKEYDIQKGKKTETIVKNSCKQDQWSPYGDLQYVVCTAVTVDSSWFGEPTVSQPTIYTDQCDTRRHQCHQPLPVSPATTSDTSRQSQLHQRRAQTEWTVQKGDIQFPIQLDCCSKCLKQLVRWWCWMNFWCSVTSCSCESKHWYLDSLFEVPSHAWMLCKYWPRFEFVARYPGVFTSQCFWRGFAARPGSKPALNINVNLFIESQVLSLFNCKLSSAASWFSKFS